MVGAGFNVMMHIKEGEDAQPTTKVWYRSNPWSLGTIIAPGEENPETEVIVCDDSTGKEVTVNLARDTHTFDRTHNLDLTDIGKLADLHEAPLLDLLRRRYASGRKVYTYSGFVLLSLNPFEPVPGLDDGPVGDAVLSPSHPPHLHVIAQRAFRALAQGPHQAILISGESGAGKTQASKTILRYLAALSNPSAFTEEASGTTSSGDEGKHRRVSVVAPVFQGGESTIESSLIAASPILESLGNATTRMNRNSSRFGRLTRVSFGTPKTGGTSDRQVVMAGASIENFLLEKPRLTGRIAGERTFHTFCKTCRLSARAAFFLWMVGVQT